MNNIHTNSSFNALNLLSQMPGLLVVMNKESQFIFLNDRTARLFGFKNTESALGLNAHQIHCPAVESANEFIEQDRLVLKTGCETTILDIHEYADSSNRILLTKKYPYRIDGEIQGAVCQATEIHSAALCKITSALIQSDRKFRPNSNNKERTYTVGMATKNQELSQRELDCMFYLLRGKTMKEIAKALLISPRTVETHLEQIRNKINCSSKSELVEYGILNGYLNFIPSHLVSKQLTNVLHIDN